ncbi:MAG: adenosylcobinamide-GDP ribazoletransferase [Solirubrobacteraceae bacterium]
MLRRAWRGLVGAITFLTIAPLPSDEAGDFRFEDTVPWFPLVGGAVGAAAGGVRVGLQPLVGSGPSTVLAMIVLVVATGALHQDALADFVDGLGVRGDPERRLSAMRDSATGAFGTLALIGWALLLYAALVRLSATDALLTLISAAAAGRLAAPLHGLAARPVRRDGLGSGFLFGWPPVVAAVLCAGAVTILATGLERGILAIGVCAVAAILSALAARRAVGGSTGDTIGAAVALAEVAVCVTLSGLWRVH